MEVIAYGAVMGLAIGLALARATGRRPRFGLWDLFLGAAYVVVFLVARAAGLSAEWSIAVGIGVPLSLWALRTRLMSGRTQAG